MIVKQVLRQLDLLVAPSEAIEHILVLVNLLHHLLLLTLPHDLLPSVQRFFQEGLLHAAEHVPYVQIDIVVSTSAPLEVLNDARRDELLCVHRDVAGLRLLDRRTLQGSVELISELLDVAV